jgi:hypothetical protein
LKKPRPQQFTILARDPRPLAVALRIVVIGNDGENAGP